VVAVPVAVLLAHFALAIPALCIDILMLGNVVTMCLQEADLLVVCDGMDNVPSRLTPDPMVGDADIMSADKVCHGICRLPRDSNAIAWHVASSSYAILGEHSQQINGTREGKLLSVRFWSNATHRRTSGG